MKKILILSCSTGEGHNSAACAVAQAARAKGCYAEIADPISFGSRRAMHAASSLYNGMIKHSPKLFGAIYQAGALYNATKLTSPIYWANALYAEHLAGYIGEKGFDAVISTHLFGMEAMTAVLKKLALDIPSYGVMTDYTCIPFFSETVLTGYFIPHRDLSLEMREKGIPEEKVYPTGIPVEEKFSAPGDRAAVRQALSIPEDQRTYLIMSGGVGCGNIAALCDGLLAEEKGSFGAYVLTGKNEKMRKALEERYPAGGPIHTVPFTSQVDLYMRAADVLLTKPGGLSSTEAVVVGVPLVHVMAIPGCETKNAAFFSSHGMSINANSAREAVWAAHHLAANPAAAEAMRRRQRENGCPHAAEQIIERVIGNE